MQTCAIASPPTRAYAPSLSRSGTQPNARCCSRLSFSQFASGSQLCIAKSLTRSRPHKRQVVTQAIFGLGGPEIAVIAGVAVLIFGPSKIPGLGKEVGKAAKSFQQAAKEFENELKSNAEDTAEQTESAYRSPKPEDEEEKPPTDTYRSTKMKNKQ